MAQSYFNLQIWKNDKQTPYLVPSRNKKNATHTWTSHILKKNHIQIDASSLRHSKKKNVHVNSQINNSLPAHKIYSIHTSSWVHHKIFGNEEKKNSRLRMPQTSTKTTKGTNKYHMYLEIMCTAHPNCTTNMRSPTPPHYLFAHSPPPYKIRTRCSYEIDKWKENYDAITRKLGKIPHAQSKMTRNTTW